MSSWKAPSWQALLLLLIAAVVMAPAPAQSQMVFNIDLEGAQEVPPVPTAATGACTLTLNVARTQLVTMCTHNVSNTTMAHIHVGAIGVAGPIVFPFANPQTPFQGTWNLSAMNVESLFDGDLYVNVHSNAFPGGEVRGQIGILVDDFETAGTTRWSNTVP